MHKPKFSPDQGTGGGQLGTEAIKKVIMFGLMLGSSFRDILKDKKVTFQEALSLLPQVMQLPELLQQLPAVKAEWADRTPEELDEINEYIQEHFDLEDDKLESAIEGAFDVVLAVLNLIDKIGDMKQKTTD